MIGCFVAVLLSEEELLLIAFAVKLFSNSFNAVNLHKTVRELTIVSVELFISSVN